MPPSYPNPFSFWQQGWQTASMVGETMFAANAVVAERLGTIGHAMRDPLAADYGELARMVGEKVIAFGEAGSALLSDAAALQTELARNAARVNAIATGAGLLSPTDMIGLWEGGARAMAIALGAQGRSLAPIHRRARANAHRLGKRKRRR